METGINGNTLDLIFDTFANLIGVTGTIAVPTFNFEFCHGKPFDKQRTPGEGMGAFSEFIRLKPGSERSRHSFHSISCWGHKAKKICQGEGKTEFSPGSSLDILLKENAKIIFLGVDFVETFVHLAEERVGVPYRFWKSFNGIYIDQDKESHRTETFYARNLNLKPEPDLDVPRIGKELHKDGLIRYFRIGQGRIGYSDANELVDYICKKLKEDPIRYLHMDKNPYI
jgi:aminoglycoside 3-N-acetyltransferase